MASANDVGDAHVVVFHALISILSARVIVDESSSDRAHRKWPRKTNATGHHPIRVEAWAWLSSARLLIVGVHVARNVISVLAIVVVVVAGRSMINRSLVSAKIRPFRDGDGNVWENFIPVIKFSDASSSCLLTWEVKVARSKCANLRRESHLYREIGGKPCET